MSDLAEHRPSARAASRPVFGLGVDAVLAEAADAAFAVAEPVERVSLLAEVAQAAVDLGRAELAAELLVDLPERSLRALLHVALADFELRRGRTAAAHHHALQLEQQLEGADRWLPRPGWLTPDDGRLELARLYLELRLDTRAEAALARLSPAAAPRGRIVVGTVRPHRGWDAAVVALRQVRDPEDRRALAERLVAAGAAAGLAGRVLALARQVRVGGAEPSLSRAPFVGVQAQRLLERSAEALAETGLTAAAQDAWALAVDHALTLDHADAVESLARIAARRAALVGDDAGRDTLALAVDLAATAAIPPDPGDPFPWRAVFRAAWDHPGIADPLLANLRGRRTLPPAWCYVLGELERATGQVERARRTAEVLEEAWEADPADPEPLWLAVLLRVHAGDVAGALPALRRLLDRVEPGTLVRLPGDADEVSSLEETLVRALLAADATAEAVSLARTLPDPERRADALHRVARALLRAGRRGEAVALIAEAAGDLAAADRSPRGRGPLSGDVARLAWVLGEADVATAVVDEALAALAEVPGPLAVPPLCDVEARLASVRAAPLVERLRAEVARRLAAADPADRCAMLLAIAEASAR